MVAQMAKVWSADVAYDLTDIIRRIAELLFKMFEEQS